MLHARTFQQEIYAAADIYFIPTADECFSSSLDFTLLPNAFLFIFPAPLFLRRHKTNPDEMRFD